jgi:hypothetical protein
MRRAVLFVALAGTASAEPTHSAAIRVSGGAGSFGELTWAAPGVDLVGTHRFCSRWSVSAAIGYAPVDNHTFLADGRIVRAALAGSMTLASKVRGALVVDLEHVAYYADPDVLEGHPGVNLVERRGGFTPTIGLEAAYPLTSALAIGAFARASLRELSLFEDGAGRGGSARFVFGGIFVDLKLR